jgi:hypothetical protein
MRLVPTTRPSISCIAHRRFDNFFFELGHRQAGFDELVPYYNAEVGPCWW